MAQSDSSRRKITVPQIAQRKPSLGSGTRITALTAYDYTFAKLVDGAGVDVILVGDSLGCVVQGNETTLPVTLDEMIYHSKCVVRGVEHALVVGDLPFLSYQPSIEEAIRSAGRLIKESGVSAVKLEGGIHMADTIRALSRLDIPVMGHVGLTPQSYHRMGGHKIQGRGLSDRETAASASAQRVIDDAHAVEEAGAFALVLEGIPADLAEQITGELSIPTIGIGAGVGCDGQILVLQDMLGMDDSFSPKFVKRFAEIGGQITAAVTDYVTEVQSGTFPAEEHSFHSKSIVPTKKAQLKMV